MALAELAPFSTSRCWFDDIDNHMRQMQQSFFRRSFSDCGMEMPLQLQAGDVNSPWKLLDDISPFKPEDIQVAIAPDGKSISLDAKSERTAADGGKISRAISKRWAWSGAVDANKLKCYIKEGALMIEAPTAASITAPPSTPQSIPVRVESGTSTIPLRMESGNSAVPVHVQTCNTAIPVHVQTSAQAQSAQTQHTAEEALKNKAMIVTVQLPQNVTAVSNVAETSRTVANNNTTPLNGTQAVAHDATFSKVYTGSVANAKRLFEDIAEKEKMVSINKVNASVSEHKLRGTASEAPRQRQTQPQKSPESMLPQSPEPKVMSSVQINVNEAQNVNHGTTQTSTQAPSTERVIPTVIQNSDTSLQTVDKSLHFFDDSLLSFERQFWENRVNAMNRFQDSAQKFHRDFIQSVHWPSIFDDSRILKSNFTEVSKGLSVKENEITANELKVALDVAGCPTENLSVRVSGENRLVVEARWMDGFTDRLARREWTLPGRVSDSDVKCTVSSDGILVIKVNLKTHLAIGDRKIPILQN